MLGTPDVWIIDLRAMEREGGKSSVLIKFGGDEPGHPINARTFVFNISIGPESIEFLGHRDYVASEWQSADVGG
jgi:hypothetical protein